MKIVVYVLFFLHSFDIKPTAVTIDMLEFDTIACFAAHIFLTHTVTKGLFMIDNVAIALKFTLKRYQNTRITLGKQLP